MKKTPEEKKAEMLAKKQAAKEKKAAKKTAMLEKKRAKAALKKQIREKKNAKKAALREKQKAKKLALKEKAKKLALKEKARAKKLKLKEKAAIAKAKERAKKLKLKEAELKARIKAEIATLKNANANANDNGKLDPKTVAKSMKTILGNIANEMVDFDNVPDKTIKWFSNMGYDISITPDGKFVSVAFTASKTKKLKTSKTTAIDKALTIDSEPKAVSDDIEVPEEPKVELVPAGDLLGTDGNVDAAEVANIEDDGNANDIIDDEFEDNDDTIADSRDEQDEDLVDNRREFFNNFGDDFEPNDN